MKTGHRKQHFRDKHGNPLYREEMALRKKREENHREPRSRSTYDEPNVYGIMGSMIGLHMLAKSLNRNNNK